MIRLQRLCRGFCAFVRTAPSLQSLVLIGGVADYRPFYVEAWEKKCVDAMFQNLVMTRAEIQLPQKGSEKLHILVRLNQKGRRYLKDGNTKSACADFLGRIDDAPLDDVYTHFRENPILCDRVPK